MSRNLILGTLLLALFIIVILIGWPASAALPDQSTNPPERLRPDQYSYHGREELPYFPGSSPDVIESQPVNSPVEQWSRMTFESYVGDSWEVYFANGDFTNLVRLTYNSSINDIQPRLDRGCLRIAFASDRVGYIYDIFTMNVDGTGVTRLTQNDTDDVSPAWSPDGTRIAFQSYRDGNAEIYVMNADGSGQTNLTLSGDYDGMPSWSPDGSKIAFVSRRTGFYHVWVMNQDGSNLVELSAQRYSEGPIWSPDGSQIGYDADSDDDGWQEVWSMDSDGSNQRLRLAPAYNQTNWVTGWSPDGESILFTGVQMIEYNGNWYWTGAYLRYITADDLVGVINFNRFEDWLLDWTTSDILPPTTSMTSTTSPAPFQFSVGWIGVDNLSGVNYYDIQVRDGSLGSWADWISGTEENSATFTGVGGHTYYFRSRARDFAYNLQPWPANYQTSVFVENVAPITHLNKLDAFTRGDQVTLTWEGYDLGGSGISGYDLQFKDGELGEWQDWLVGTLETSATFNGEPGHTNFFRLRATDFALNVGAWPSGEGNTSTIFYSWRSAGMIRDHTGIPIAGADISVDPAAFLTFPSDRDGFYSAYLASNPDVKTLTWSKSIYGALPPTVYGLADANVDVYLPPLDNTVQDWGFESGQLPGYWQTGGTIPPTLDGTNYHSGQYAVLLGSPLELGDPVNVASPALYNELFNPFAFDPQGGLHMAWADWDNGYHVYYSYQLPDRSWSPKELVSQPANIPSLVRISIDDNSTIHIVYGMEYGGIFYTQRDTGGSWSDPIDIAPDSWLRSIDIDRSNNFHLIFSVGTVLYYGRITPMGDWFIEHVPVVQGFNQAALVIDLLGRVHFVWTYSDYKGSFVMYAVRSGDGSWSAPVTISQAIDAFSIDILLDSNGTPNVVWGATGDTNKLYYSRLNPGEGWTEPYNFSGDIYMGSYTILIDDQDTLYIIWSGNNWRPGTEGIYFVQKDSADNWSYPYKISLTSNVASYPSAAISGGDIYAVWEEETELNTDVFFARFQAGRWSAPIQLSNTPIYSFFPHIALDPMNGVHIAWCETDDANVRDLFYLESLPLEQNESSWLAQSVTIPISMTNPTLSFLASLSGVSEMAGNHFDVLVSTGTTTTTLFTSTTPGSWENFWFDMTPWSGQAITLTFQLTEIAGFPPASAILDEVTLGAAHPDTWVVLTSHTPAAHPGEPFEFTLDYGNRGVVAAESATITLTLPPELSFVEATIPPSVIGDQLTWQVGDLPADEPQVPIIVTVAVDAGASLGQAVTSSVEISTASVELEVLNNSSQVETYLGYHQILPILQR